MKQTQRYILTIWDLFTIQGGALCGVSSEVAILDGGMEIDRLTFTGKYQGEDGYRRTYVGKPDLTAELASGPGRIQFSAEELKTMTQV